MSGTSANRLTSTPWSRTYPHWFQRFFHRLGYAARDVRSERGFTLIEVVVAFTVFVIVAAGAITGIVNAIQTTHVSQQRVVAANVGQQDLATDLAAYRAAGTVPQRTTYTATVGGEQFSVTRSVTFQPNNVTACTPGASFLVHVQVNQAQTGRFLTQTDTVIAC